MKIVELFYRCDGGCDLIAQDGRVRIRIEEALELEMHTSGFRLNLGRSSEDRKVFEFNLCGDYVGELYQFGPLVEITPGGARGISFDLYGVSGEVVYRPHELNRTRTRSLYLFMNDEDVERFGIEVEDG